MDPRQTHSSERGMMLFQLVRRARRRFLCNEILAQFAFALSTAFGAVILLLLLGTQVLEWHWLVLLPAITLAWGLYRTWRRLPSGYQLSQLIDRRLGFADTFSTAIYFQASAAAARVSGEVRLAQLARADHLAERVILSEAVPFTMPRAVYAMAFLGLIASSLFALRYGLNRRLDLRPPLASIVQEALGIGEHPKKVETAKKDPHSKRPEASEAMAVPVENGDRKNPGELDAAPDSALETTKVPDVDNSKNGNAKIEPHSKGQSPSASEQGQEQNGSEMAENSQTGNSGREGQRGSSKNSPQGQQAAASQTGSPSQNSSLMNKFRDAMSNLLSRMRQQGNGSQQQSASQQQGQQGQKQGAAGQKSTQGQQSGAQQAQSQDGQASQDSQNAQNAQGKGAGRSGDQQSSQQPGSGVGRQDGSKDIKMAEQLAAMGKISEIIGKRSANISGEVTVEVQSGRQQLHTPYSQRSARHQEAISEINRDEVPVALQPYVQQYFEQVRKQSAGSR